MERGECIAAINHEHEVLSFGEGYMKTFIAVAVVVVSVTFRLNAQTAPVKPEIGIDDKLGAQLPMQTQFYDEHGYLVSLKDIITEPTILNLVYFKCPGICSPILTELTTIVNHLDMEIGREYQIVTISFDETEKPELAEAKRENYMSLVNKSIPENSWKFLTGDSASIRAVTNAAGFLFRRDGDNFIHAGAIIVLSPQGKVTRYLYGTQYLPFDVKMALVEANEGRPSPTINKLLKYCFSYNPEGRTYALNVRRIAGTGILVLAAAFVMFLRMKPRKRQDPAA
jgi:protein SCO1